MKGSTYKRGKIWWCTWSEKVKGADGEIRSKKMYASSGSEKESEAQTLLTTKIYESKKQGVRTAGQEAEKLTYEDIRDRWLKHRATQPNSKPQILKNGDTYFAGRKHLDAYFGGWRAVNINTDDIEKFQKMLRAKGLGNGIDRAVSALRAMLNFAAKPRKGVARLAEVPDEFPMLHIKRKEPEPIGKQYFEPLCNVLPEPWRTPFVLAWHSGLRLTEIERLKWKHVNLDSKKLRFPGAKTFEDRSVPLLANTADLLAALPRGGPGDPVFPKFTDATARTRAWRRAAVTVGCGAWHCPKCDTKLKAFKCPEHGRFTEETARYEGSLFRWTRTTAIRRLTNKGVPTVRIMQMMGHKHLPTHMGYNVTEEDEDLALIREKYESKV